MLSPFIYLIIVSVRANDNCSMKLENIKCYKNFRNKHEPQKDSPFEKKNKI